MLSSDAEHFYWLSRYAERAENTARQINATNQQQTDQFFANLISTIGQQNTAQANATNQFN